MFYLVLVQFYLHFDTTSNDQNDAMATAFFLKRQNDGFQFALLQYIVILEI